MPSKGLESLQRLEVEQKRIDKEAFTSRYARLEDAPHLIDSPTQLWAGGELVVVYAPLAEGELELLPERLQELPFKSGGYRTSGLTSDRATFGWMPRRTLRQDYCHKSIMATEQPDVHNALEDAAELADSYYRDLFPSKYETHEWLLRQMRPDYRLRGTVFTSGIVNQNSALAYHVDGGNFKGSWSLQLTFKKGVSGGSYLAFPEFGVTFEVADRTLLIFNGQEWTHGVTPFDERLGEWGPNCYRYSVVFYSMRQLCNCFSPKEEIDRIRKRKQEQEARRSGMGPKQGDLFG